MTNPVDEHVLPRIAIGDPAAIEVHLVHRLQRVLLMHPVACQAAFTALVAEGRRFADTDEGRGWRDRLTRSDLLRQVRLVFDLSTLGLLEEATSPTLPSSYLDALFMIAAGGDADAVLNRVFWSGSDAASDGHAGK